MPRKVAIVGVGEAVGALVPNRTHLELHVEAALAALEDAGLGPGDVDGLFSAGVHMLHPLIVCEYMGLKPRYTDSTMTGGGVWEYFVEHAVGAIEAGLCETALLVYGATEASDVRKGLRTGDLAPLPRGPSQFEAPYGLTLIGKYALAARRHMAEFGTSSEQLAEISVAANRWAQKNPSAWNHGKPITIDDVLSSRMIADPLRRYDCCLHGHPRRRMSRMDETQYKAYRPHLPIPDGETEPYWEAAREGRLRLKRCRPCNRPFFYPRSHCPRCWSADTDWIDASGRGRIYSYTVIAHSDVTPFKDQLPYVVALVDLEEGPRMVTNVVGADPAELAVGRLVEVVFERIDERITLPKFRISPEP